MVISDRQKLLAQHIRQLLACRRCPRMQSTPVSGSAVLSRIMIVGQAPGVREPIAGRPFAWTAGRKLFRWLEEATGWNEAEARSKIYFAAVCRCFPGKSPLGGDRVPDPEEVANCAPWMQREFELLRPRLLILVGRLAIGRFLPATALENQVGRIFVVPINRRDVDVLPLPHPSGASTWPHREPGKTLLARALELLREHPAIREARDSRRLG